jgi:hypothetical protein
VGGGGVDYLDVVILIVGQYGTNDFASVFFFRFWILNTHMYIVCLLDGLFLVVNFSKDARNDEIECMCGLRYIEMFSLVFSCVL